MEVYFCIPTHIRWYMCPIFCPHHMALILNMIISKVSNLYLLFCNWITFCIIVHSAIQCLSMYGKMQASGFTAMIPLISISTIQWQYLGFSSWIPLGVHLPSCYCGRRLDSGQLVGRLLTWQAIFWGGPHNYALEIRYLSFPEAQTSHSSILKWIFKRVLKTRLSPGYSQIDEERDEIFKFIHQRFPEALLCEHFSF